MMNISKCDKWKQNLKIQKSIKKTKKIICNKIQHNSLIVVNGKGKLTDITFSTSKKVKELVLH